MSIELYHLANSRSQRIIWLFEELEINYELKILEQNKPNNSAQAIDKFPTVYMADDNLWLHESSAIAEYFFQQQQKLIIEPTSSNYWDFCYFKNLPMPVLCPI